MSLLGEFGIAGLPGKIVTLKTSYDAHVAATTGIHGAVSTDTASTLIIRDANARAEVADPPASDSTQLIATTNWVQSEISAGGGGTVTSVTQGTGMNFSTSPITATGTINLANTAVTPGTYTLATITVDAQGRLTSASNGSGVTNVTGTAPVASSGGTTPAISMAAATGSNHGYMTLTQASKLDGIEASADVNDVDTVFGRTGAVTANAGDYTVQKISGITISASGPSGGANGDIHFRFS